MSFDGPRRERKGREEGLRCPKREETLEREKTFKDLRQVTLAAVRQDEAYEFGSMTEHLPSPSTANQPNRTFLTHK